MCGRFTSSSPGDIVAQAFGLPEVPQLAPRYNVSPGQDVPVIRVREGARRLDLLRWGLIPSWAKAPEIGHRLINARAETAGEKPAFRSALRHRRCLLVADGFYEWAVVEGRKRPYLIRFRDHRPFGLAGLWESWRGGAGEAIETCTILTTTPNGVVAPLHDRMPVIVPPGDYGSWLDPQRSDVSSLAALLAPFPGESMAAQAVSPRVNNPANDDPALVEGAD